MAPPPKPPPPPPPDYFERGAALAAAKAAAASSSSTLSLAPPTPPAFSFTDTISDISPYIPITLDLSSHNYDHWRQLFDVHLGRCNLRSHVASTAIPQPHDPKWVKDDLTP